MHTNENGNIDGFKYLALDKEAFQILPTSVPEGN
jgi:hypothetical protein